MCILNPDRDFLRDQALANIIETRRNKKKVTYSEAAEQRRATFTPFIATCNAVLDKEAESYIKRLALFLSKKWSCHNARACGWLRARLQICILRSVSLCIRGSRTKWRGAGVEDGLGIPRLDLVC